MTDYIYPVVGPVIKNISKPITKPKKSKKPRGGGGGGAPSSLLDELVAWWSNDEASGTRLDSHTNGYDLTDVLGGIGSEAGQVGNAAVGSGGSSERLSIADALTPLLNFQDDDFTISTWIKANAFTDGQIILNKWLLGGYQLSVTDGDRIIMFMGETNYTWTASLSVDTWYHVLMYHDATNDLIGISVDNAAAETAALVGGVLTGAILELPFDICGSSGGAFGFNGSVDETAIWSRLLTAGEKTQVAAGIAYPG